VKLEELAARGRLLTRPESGDVDVAGVTSDPAAVRPGDVFVVVGRGYGAARRDVAEAVKRGAVAVVAEERDVAAPCAVPVLMAQDARRALAFMAAGFAGRAADLRLCGVTGTNGKSWTLALFAAAMEAAGVRTAVLENERQAVGRGPRGRRAAALGAERTADELAAAAGDGYAACGLEFSSASLALGRAEGVRFGCGVFTTFARDRIDFHGSSRELLEAQLELFRLLPTTAAAIVNADDPAHELFLDVTRGRALTYGVGGRADVRGEIRRLDVDGLDLEIRTPLGRASLRSPLVGRAAASNLLGALAAALSLGAPLESAVEGLASVAVVPGRMERVDARGPVEVFVDYARNEAAFEQALATARGLARGRVIAVFGASGDRSRGRRARLGRAADRLADVAVVTSENPRSENPADIIAAIVAGFSRLDRVEVELDRGAAVRRAIELARPGDVVLVAGKGPETSYEFGDRLVRFEDAAEARGALALKRSLG
jgi:UDP-N-acetylmuramoyl-L-alanyl-D-glutamate--2,6-diaminopimelate ligase